MTPDINLTSIWPADLSGSVSFRRNLTAAPLPCRLYSVVIPALVIWGETDGIASTHRVCAHSLPHTGIDLIQRLACENPRWGVELIRGELLKLGIPIAKRTFQE